MEIQESFSLLMVAALLLITFLMAYILREANLGVCFLSFFSLFSLSLFSLFLLFFLFLSSFFFLSFLFSKHKKINTGVT